MARDAITGFSVGHDVRLSDHVRVGLSRERRPSDAEAELLLFAPAEASVAKVGGGGRIDVAGVTLEPVPPA